MSVALVTGATGLVGSHIVDQLIANGWSVRALARSPEAARDELPPSVEIRQGDVLDERSFERAARGCHVVFHAAANVLARGGWEAYRITNVDGTRNAISAASSAGARLLHVSSVAVYGPSARYDMAKAGKRTDESVQLPPLNERAFYARSKRESEELVLRAHTQGRVWATAVRPDVVYGPRDRQFVPRMARLMTHFPVPLLRGGRSILGVVQAGNVASGSVLAATSDVAGGKAYNLANDFDVSVRRFFELGGEGLGRRPMFVPGPLWAARSGLRAAKTVMRALSGGKFSMVSNAAIDFISEDNPFSSDRAKSELAWSPSIRPEDGVPAAFRWWLENKRARR
ncbi:MAG: NAD-dependent epimerase/dehydratase family protein [Gemmatimonadaceae bacterium]